MTQLPMTPETALHFVVMDVRRRLEAGGEDRDHLIALLEALDNVAADLIRLRRQDAALAVLWEGKK